MNSDNHPQSFASKFKLPVKLIRLSALLLLTASAFLVQAFVGMADDSNAAILAIDNKSGYDDSLVFFTVIGTRLDTKKNVYFDFKSSSFVESDPFSFDASSMTASIDKIKSLNKDSASVLTIPKPDFEFSGRVYFSFGDNFDKLSSFPSSGPSEGKSNTLLYDKFEFDLGGSTGKANFINQTNVDHYAISYTIAAYDCNKNKVITTGITSPSESIYKNFTDITSSPSTQNYGNTDLFKQLLVSNDSGQYVRVIAPKASAYSEWNAANSEPQKLTHFFDDYIAKNCWKPNRKFKFCSKDNPTVFYYGKVSADGKTLNIYTDDKFTKAYAKVPSIPRLSSPWGKPDFASNDRLWSNVGNAGTAWNDIDWGFVISAQAAVPADYSSSIQYKLGNDPVAMTIPVSICRGVMHLNDYDPAHPLAWKDKWSDSSEYYKGAAGKSTSDTPIFYYGKILHDAASGGLAYALSFDDIYGSDSTISFRKPDVNLVIYPVLAEGKGAMTVIASAGGKVSPEKFNEYALNTKTTVTATPDAGYVFSGWTATKGVSVEDSSKASTSATVTGIGTLTANFAHKPASLTVSAVGSGSATPLAGSVSTVDQETPIDISAVADAGYAFVNWTVTGNATIADASSASTSVTLKGDATVTANFAADANVANSGTPILGINGNQGDRIVYKVTVPAGITKMTVSGKDGSGDCDIYASPNAVPSRETFYARSAGSAETENLTVLNPLATDWYILVYAYGDFTGSSLIVTLLNDVPGVPTLLGANRTSPTSVALNWTDCSAVGAQSYHVYRSEDNFRNSAHLLTSFNGVKSNSYSDLTAVPGTHYYYWVRSVNGSGSSDFSNSLKDLDLTGEYELAVKNLSNGSTLAGIKGDAGTTSKYMIRIPLLASPAVLLEIRSGGGTGDCEISVEKDGIILKNGVRYGNNETIRIENPVAGDYVISLFANKAFSGVTLFAKYYNSKPAPPSIVNAGDRLFSDSISVAWNAADGATSYEVWRGTSSKSASAVRIAETPGLSHVDISNVKNVLNGKATYYYWIKAKNGAGTSAFSAYNAGSLTDIPVAPGTFTASKGLYFDKIKLTWSAAPTATSYMIYRNITNDFSEDEFLVEVPAGTGTTLTYEDFGGAMPTTGWTYYYFIKSKNSSGTSDTYSSDTGSLYSKPITGLTASRGTYLGKVKLTWTSLAGATQYIVYRSDDTITFAIDKLTDQTGTSETNVYYDIPPIAGTPYVYWVVADYNGFYQTDLGSGILGWSKAAATTSPSAPVLKSVGNGESNFVRVVWDEVPLAASYNVYRRALATDPWDLLTNTVALTYNDNPPMAYQKYMYHVTAFNGIAESARSSIMYGYKAGDSAVFKNDDVPVNVNGTYLSQKIYTIKVPAGCSRLVATLTPLAGTAGDCDLYAKFASYPTLSIYNAKGVETGAGNKETLTVTNPSAGDWYILLYGASPAAFSNVNFSVNYYFATDILLTQVPADDQPVPFSAVFKGKVQDELGAGIPGVSVGVRDPVSGITSWLPKTDANGVFTFSKSVTSEGEFTYDFCLSSIPDATRSIASWTLKTAMGFRESNAFFDFAGYLPRESFAVTQDQAIGLQTYMNIRRGFSDGPTDSDYEDFWIGNTLGTASYDMNILSKLDSGLYLLYHGTEGAAVGNANITGNMFTATPLLVHVAAEKLDTVLGNLKAGGMIENELADKVVSGGIGVVVLSAVRNPDESGFGFDYDISLYAQEQLELLAKIAGNSNVSASTSVAPRKYGNQPVKFMNVSINRNVRRITVAVSSFME